MSTAQAVVDDSRCGSSGYSRAMAVAAWMKATLWSTTGVARRSAAGRRGIPCGAAGKDCARRLKAGRRGRSSSGGVGVSALRRRDIDNGAVNGVEQLRGGTLSGRSLIDEGCDSTRFDDSRDSNECLVDYVLKNTDENLQSFDSDETQPPSAHTIGQATCGVFRSRLYNNDTNIDEGFRTLRAQTRLSDQRWRWKPGSSRSEHNSNREKPRRKDIPSTRDVHESYCNSYTGKHQQGRNNANKDRYGIRTKTNPKGRYWFMKTNQSGGLIIGTIPATFPVDRFSHFFPLQDSLLHFLQKPSKYILGFGFGHARGPQFYKVETFSELYLLELSLLVTIANLQASKDKAYLPTEIAKKPELNQNLQFLFEFHKMLQTNIMHSGKWCRRHGSDDAKNKKSCNLAEYLPKGCRVGIIGFMPMAVLTAQFKKNLGRWVLDPSFSTSILKTIFTYKWLQSLLERAP
ncbi:hypothetical protein Syun_009289 [Stephania yunnanensis]|uniref:Uncharacterized protein n=1 Tax=Stephania yunnanensis TaxID=152371 RepID=A0AAP0KFA5_9MAGN